MRDFQPNCICVPFLTHPPIFLTMSGDDEYDVWPNTVELCFGRVRILKVQALGYLKRLGVAACTIDMLHEVADESQTVYWVTFKASTDHAAFLERHGVERTQKLGDLDVKVACADKSQNFRDVFLSKIPPNTNLDAVRTVLRNYGKVTKCDWEVYQDKAMGDLVGCKTGFVKIRMVVENHIPSYVHVGPHRAFVTYRGQPATCRHCDERGHMFIACPKRRVRRGPLGQAQNVVANETPVPPHQAVPSVPTGKKKPKTIPRGGGAAPGKEQLAWADVVSNKRKVNEGNSDTNSKLSRSNSLGESVAQPVSEPAPQPLNTGSVPNPSPGTLVRETIKRATIILDEAELGGANTTGKSHVSETQLASDEESNHSDMEEVSEPSIASRTMSSGQSVVFEKRPLIPSLSSLIFDA